MTTQKKILQSDRWNQFLTLLHTTHLHEGFPKRQELISSGAPLDETFIEFVAAGGRCWITRQINLNDLLDASLQDCTVGVKTTPFYDCVYEIKTLCDSLLISGRCKLSRDETTLSLMIFDIGVHMVPFTKRLNCNETLVESEALVDALCLTQCKIDWFIPTKREK